MTNFDYDRALAQAPQRMQEFGFLPPLLPIPMDLAPLRKSIIDYSESGAMNPVYHTRAARDLHSRSKTMMKLIVWSPLVAVLQKLLGPDLIVWRSQVFYKKPGAGVIDWHQEWGRSVYFRVTSSASLLYPSRLQGDFVDGFGWDLRNHRA